VTVGSILGDAVLSKTAPERLANFQNGSQGSAKRTRFRKLADSDGYRPDGDAESGPMASAWDSDLPFGAASPDRPSNFGLPIAAGCITPHSPASLKFGGGTFPPRPFRRTSRDQS
jgi:hypothetical protein